MPSRTHICNLALNEIGQPPITDIADVTRNAQRCNLMFDDIVDEVAASKYWSKLKERVELALLPDPPIYEFNFQFQLPSDHLEIISINDNQQETVIYQIEKGILLINDSSVFIKYIQKQSNPEKWGQLLERVVVLRLAAGLCYITTGDKALTNDIYSRYDLYSRRYSSLDSNQGSRRKIRAKTITRVR